MNVVLVKSTLTSMFEMISYLVFMDLHVLVKMLLEKSIKIVTEISFSVVDYF